MMARPWRPTVVVFVVGIVAMVWVWESSIIVGVEAGCVPAKGCTSAYAYYRVQTTEDLTTIGNKFGTSDTKIHQVNPAIGPEIGFILTDQPLFIPFNCKCINDLLLQTFIYSVPKGGDSLSNITRVVYENLTQPSWVASWNSLKSSGNVAANTPLEIPVNCSCGKPSFPEYGLFVTYPVVAGTAGNLSGIAADLNTTADVVKKLNPGVVWDDDQPTQYAFIPVRDLSGQYPPYEGDTSTSGKKSGNTGVIAGAVVGGIIAFLIVVALVVYFVRKRAQKKKKSSLRLADPLFAKSGQTYSSASDRVHSSSSQASSNPRSASFVPTSPTGLADFTVDKSVQFSYEELASATCGFSMANKIGEGGFATVFYGEIRGQKLAIKRMNLQATKEFMAELQVLTHVHHTNLVQLIGYCTTEYLFLCYEFVENGTLDFHLHSSRAAKEPLSWSSRVQIALDAARGLEYIHEHTKPTYIHRDIKTANILIDKDFHAKVADFGLTKLTETKVAGAVTQPTRVVGTWGYMSPEYARFGEVSPMVDVYSFGVVLFEILSGREAIMRGGALSFTQDFVTSSSNAPPKEEQRALVSFFDPVLKSSNGKEKLSRFMDPKLGDDYPQDAAWKLAQLAGACTQEVPSKRPTMRNAVVALMTLSSTTQDWDVGVSPKSSSIKAK